MPEGTEKNYSNWTFTDSRYLLWRTALQSTRRLLVLLLPQSAYLHAGGPTKLYVCQHCDTFTIYLNPPPPKLFVNSALWTALLRRHPVSLSQGVIAAVSHLACCDPWQKAAAFWVFTRDGDHLQRALLLTASDIRMHAHLRMPAMQPLPLLVFYENVNAAWKGLAAAPVFLPLPNGNQPPSSSLVSLIWDTCSRLKGTDPLHRS